MNDYTCCACGTNGVKLWREYNSFHISLKCRACSEIEQAPALDRIKEHKNLALWKTDTIGWRVPAIPDGEGNFWGYTSTPDDRYDWWESLPEVNLWRRR